MEALNNTKVLNFWSSADKFLGNSDIAEDSIMKFYCPMTAKNIS